MFLTPHTSAALWITTKVTNPFLALLFGLISHFILDIIPHGDEAIGQHKPKGRARFLYLVKVATVDTILAAILVYYYVTQADSFDRLVMAGALMGAWLPDFLWIGIETFRLKWLNFYIRFHSRVHRLIDWHYSPVYGVPFQIIVTLFMIKMAF